MRRDLLIVALGVVVSAAAALSFNLFDRIYLWSRRFELFQLDELFPVALAAATLLTWFAVRRVREGRAANLRLNRILGALVRGATLEDTLAILVAETERQIPGMHGVILLRDLETGGLTLGAAPSVLVGSGEGAVACSLPDSDGWIAAGGGDEPIVIPDAQAESPPTRRGQLARDLGFRGSWSVVAFALDGSVLGVLCALFRKPRRPQPKELGRLAIAARLAAVVIERTTKDAAFRKSEEDYRLLFENARDAILVFRPEDELILAANPFSEEVYGVPRDQLIGRSIQSFSKDPDRGREHIENTLREGSTHRFETTQLHADGHELSLDINASVVAYKGQRAILSLNRDVTEQRRLRASLLQAQKMEALGRLAGGVAHDFNNLLTAIRGAADLASLVAPAESGLDDHLRMIQQAADRAAGLTRQLLTFSRQQVVRPQRLDVNAVASEVETILRRVLGEDVELRVRQGSGLPRVFIDPGQLQQVLVNLAVNSRDAMPAGGRLEISTAARLLDGGQRRVAVAVRDWGTGMSEAVKRQAFDPFFTTKPAGKGTGLGLSIVYGIVSQAGGEVEIDSAVGRGTTITILLPEAPAGTAADGDAGATASPAAQLSLPATSVLLVEDDPAVRRFLVRCLRDLGLAVDEAENGPAALERLRRGDPAQVLFTDVILPGMAGPDLAREARSLRPGIKVLYMSGYAGDRLEEVLSGRDNAPLLAKPFSREELIEFVRRALGS
jgi:PAS domain S-box-containing protein